LNEELNGYIERGNSVLRLLDNKDFQEIIMKGYLEDSVLAISSNLNKIGADKRNMLVEQIMSRTYTRDYLQDILNAKASAEQQLADELEYAQSNNEDGENN
jgi:hypothetical protein